MTDIMKILVLLRKGVAKTIENETKEQRGEFLSMLLGTLGTYCNKLIGRYVSRQRTDQGWWWSNQSWTGFLVPHHPLKCRSIIRMNLNFKVFNYEIICQTIRRVGLM